VAPRKAFENIYLVLNDLLLWLQKLCLSNCDVQNKKIMSAIDKLFFQFHFR
jgi:hypothetical protein